MVELKFIIPNNSTTVQLLRIMEMIVYLGETMELLPRELDNTNDIDSYFHNEVQGESPRSALSIYFHQL